MSRDESGWKEFQFVLVHGAGHGGWCWYKVKTLLEAEGHKVSTVDLTSAGINATPFYDVLTFSQYNHPLTTLMDSLPTTEKVVLVGHSLGGLNITDVVYKFPEKIVVAVYLAANMLKEGYSLISMLLQDNTPEIHHSDIHDLLKLLIGTLIKISHWEVVRGSGLDVLPGVMVKPEFQRSTFYNMSPVQDSTLAGTLLRPTPVVPLLDVPFKATEPGLSVPRVYVRTLKDQMMSQSSQDQMIAQWPPSKVYALGSDHSAFFSTPVELVRVLVDVATTFSHKNS